MAQVMRKRRRGLLGVGGVLGHAVVEYARSWRPGAGGRDLAILTCFFALLACFLCLSLYAADGIKARITEAMTGRFSESSFPLLLFAGQGVGGVWSLDLWRALGEPQLYPASGEWNEAAWSALLAGRNFGPRALEHEAARELAEALAPHGTTWPIWETDFAELGLARVQALLAASHDNSGEASRNRGWKGVGSATDAFPGLVLAQDDPLWQWLTRRADDGSHGETAAGPAIVLNLSVFAEPNLDAYADWIAEYAPQALVDRVAAQTAGARRDASSSVAASALERVRGVGELFAEHVVQGKRPRLMRLEAHWVSSLPLYKQFAFVIDAETWNASALARNYSGFELLRPLVSAPDDDADPDEPLTGATDPSFSRYQEGFMERAEYDMERGRLSKCLQSGRPAAPAEGTREARWPLLLPQPEYDHCLRTLGDAALVKFVDYGKRVTAASYAGVGPFATEVDCEAAQFMNELPFVGCRGGQRPARALVNSAPDPFRAHFYARSRDDLLAAFEAVQQASESSFRVAALPPEHRVTGQRLGFLLKLVDLLVLGLLAAGAVAVFAGSMVQAESLLEHKTPAWLYMITAGESFSWMYWKLALTVLIAFAIGCGAGVVLGHGAALGLNHLFSATSGAADVGRVSLGLSDLRLLDTGSKQAVAVSLLGGLVLVAAAFALVVRRRGLTPKCEPIALLS